MVFRSTGYTVSKEYRKVLCYIILYFLKVQDLQFFFIFNILVETLIKFCSIIDFF